MRLRVLTWSRPLFLALAVLAAVLATKGDALSSTTITLPPDFSDELVASVATPTALAFTPDGRMLITTQTGQLRVYEDSSLVSTPALDLGAAGNFCSTSERGLLGVAVDPGFASNGFIYLYYSPRIDGDCKNRLSRFTMTGNTVSLASQSILVDNIPAPFGTHNAGDVHVGKDGNLYVSVGDGGGDYAEDSGSGAANDAARDMHALVGKILRITRDGGIPADNPFQGPGTVRCHQTGTTTAPNKCQEIFATGLRNPFRIAFDPNASGTVFHINDVGQNTWEEIDLGASGADYGWNVREGPCATGSITDCGPPPAGMTNPIFSYKQGDPSGCRAITGGAFVPAGIWPPAYDGAYLFADYVCGKIFRLNPQPGGSYVRAEFASALGSNSAVSLTFGPYQETQVLYYTTYEEGGSVRRIAYTGAANRIPTAALSAAPTSGPAPLAVNLDGSGSSDPDAGDTLVYLWDFGDGQTTSGSGPTISHTYSSVGTFTASLRVRDNHGAVSLPATVQIQPGNTAPAPTIDTPAAGATFRVNQNVVLHGSATDPQDGALPPSSLRWQVLRHHGTSHTHPWLPETGGNDISISTPAPEDLATTTTSYLEVRLTATDSQGLATTVTREFRPTLVDLSFATDPSGLGLGLNGESVTTPFRFASWEGWSFPISASRQQDGAGAAWVFDRWSDGGAANHTITTGAAPTSYTATFRPNTVPVATGSSVSTPEDAAYTVVLSATDADSDPLSFSIKRSPGKGTLGPVTGNSVVYTPAVNANGNDSFEFSASDGAAVSTNATVSITITPVNDPPVAGDDTASVAEDNSFLVNVRANDTDVDGDPLSVTAATPGPQTNGMVAVESGQVRYTPTTNFNGQGVFDYTISDGAGGSDTGRVTVTVTPVNDAPTAADDTATTPAGVAVTVDVLANDSPGPPDESGQVLSVSSVGAAEHGAAARITSGVDAGKVRYTPDPGYTGPDSFTYQACDDGSGAPCHSAIVAVTVREANRGPAATSASVSATEDVGATIVLDASDPDGDALSLAVVTGPAHGTLSALAGRSVTYVPASNYNGPDSFTFRASDGALESNLATVSIAVAPVNDAPVAVPDAVRVATDAPVLIDVLANDSAGPADEGGQTLRLTGVGTPAHGTAAAVDGRVLYTPAREHNGPDAFSYIVCDDGASGGAPDGRCATGTIDFAFVAFRLPANVAPPRVVGGTRAGSVVVAEHGEWDAAPRAVEYRWLRCPPTGRAGCVSIAGATGPRYRVALADIGRVLRVFVTVHNRFGAGGAISAPTRLIASPVVIAAVRHRGDDWVLLENETSLSVPLRGWSLSDAGGSLHTFGRVTARPLRTLRIDTRDVWNARDRATLRLPGGRLADTCAYRARRATARC